MAAHKSLSKVSRDQFRRSAKTSAVLARHDAKRAALRQEMSRSIQREEELARQLLDVQWDIVKGMVLS